ncbi:hypothetical protein BGW41_000382 [Actinomortierella wolfii]|nr:hypothetical protein BGW41_000382 [Actinomortierella wolfii]
MSKVPVIHSSDHASQAQSPPPPASPSNNSDVENEMPDQSEDPHASSPVREPWLSQQLPMSEESTSTQIQSQPAAAAAASASAVPRLRPALSQLPSTCSPYASPHGSASGSPQGTPPGTPPGSPSLPPVDDGEHNSPMESFCSSSSAMYSEARHASGYSRTRRVYSPCGSGDGSGSSQNSSTQPSSSRILRSSSANNNTSSRAPLAPRATKAEVKTVTPSSSSSPYYPNGTKRKRENGDDGEGDGDGKGRHAKVIKGSSTSSSSSGNRASSGSQRPKIVKNSRRGTGRTKSSGRRVSGGGGHSSGGNDNGRTKSDSGTKRGKSSPGATQEAAAPRKTNTAKSKVTRDNLLNAIVSAIKSLKDKQGSTRSKIKEFIESNYDTRNSGYDSYFNEIIKASIKGKKPRLAYTTQNGSRLALAGSATVKSAKTTEKASKTDATLVRSSLSSSSSSSSSSASAAAAAAAASNPKKKGMARSRGSNRATTDAIDTKTGTSSPSRTKKGAISKGTTKTPIARSSMAASTRKVKNGRGRGRGRGKK